MNKRFSLARVAMGVLAVPIAIYISLVLYFWIGYLFFPYSHTMKYILVVEKQKVQELKIDYSGEQPFERGKTYVFVAKKGVVTFPKWSRDGEYVSGIHLVRIEDFTGKIIGKESPSSPGDFTVVSLGSTSNGKESYYSLKLAFLDK